MVDAVTLAIADRCAHAVVGGRARARARARWSRPEQHHRARALIEDGAARGAASLQQDPRCCRYRCRASLRREELSLRPPADARQKLHKCQVCTPYAGAEGLEQSER